MFYSDPVAQSAEQLPFKQWVRGSNPRRVTKEKHHPVGWCFSLERLMGVEPTYAAWEAAVLPMNYSRRNVLYYSRPFFILQHEKWRVF